MKIPKDLPQFDDQKALIAVTGYQSAVFYEAQDGEIKEVEKLRIKKPKYSDNEGFFMQSGHGRVFATGSTREPKNDKVRIDFINKFEDAIKNVVKEEGITDIYLFAPEHEINDTKEHLPYGSRKLLKRAYKGNYIKLKPFDILKKIKGEVISAKDADWSDVKASGGAVQIYKKTSKTKKVIGDELLKKTKKF